MSSAPPGTPNWVTVLRTLHDGERGWYDRPRDGTFDDDHELATATGLDPDDLSRSVEFLKECGLLEFSSTTIRLSETGFRVIHDRIRERRRVERESRRSRRQHQVNRAIGFLTLGLVSVNAVSVAQLASVNTRGSPVVWLLSWSDLWTAAAFVVALAMFYLVISSGMLSTEPDEDELSI